MNDKQIPEAELDDLMEKIRDEVLRRKAGTGTANKGMTEITLVDKPINNQSYDKWDQVGNAISIAEQFSQVGTSLPSMQTFQGWRRRIALFAGKIYLRVSQVITRDQRAFNGSILTAVSGLQEAAKQIDSVVKQNIEHLSHIDILEQNLNELKNKHLKTEKDVNEFRTLVSSVKSETNERLSDISSRLSIIETETNKRLSDISSQLSNIYEELSNQTIEVNSKIGENTLRLQSEIENLNLELKKASQKTDYLKNSMLLQDRRLALLIEEARRCIPESFSKKQMESFIEKANEHLDPLYFEFEDQFRGTREDIKERQRIYLQYVREAKAGTELRPVLDLGCGRGEWLELLKEEGFIARGVDMNTAMISLCNDLALDVAQSDVLQYLRDLPDESLGAVTGFHIIEHLSFEVLLKLFDETVRVLKTGGIAIFETPNPENIQVGSCNFYFDPTHRTPLPSPMIKFMAEARGLSSVDVLNLNPYPESYWLSGSELAERFSQLFYGPQDYAVVGWKA